MQKILSIVTAVIMCLSANAQDNNSIASHQKEYHLVYRALEETDPGLASMNPMSQNGVRTVDVYVSGNKSCVADTKNGVHNIYDLDNNKITVYFPRINKAVVRSYEADKADPMGLLRQYGAKVNETSDVTTLNGSRAIHSKVEASMMGTEIVNEAVVIDTMLVLPEAFHASMGFITKGGVPAKLMTRSSISLGGKKADTKLLFRLIELKDEDVDPNLFLVPKDCVVTTDLMKITALAKENNAAMPADSGDQATGGTYEVPASFEADWTF